MGKGKQKQCVGTRLPRYGSREAAEDIILDGKIKSAINGSRGDEDREAEGCETCGGWHVVIRPRRQRRGGS